jgi:hypothetical protein
MSNNLKCLIEISFHTKLLVIILLYITLIIMQILIRYVPAL